jgi:hypothetical protein
VRSLNAGVVEQREEAAGVVLHREVFGRVTGLSASWSVPRYDVEVTAEIVDLCPPDATIGDESVQEDQRRPGSAATIGDAEAVTGGEGVHSPRGWLVAALWSLTIGRLPVTTMRGS